MGDCRATGGPLRATRTVVYPGDCSSRVDHSENARRFFPPAIRIPVFYHADKFFAYLVPRPLRLTRARHGVRVQAPKRDEATGILGQTVGSSHASGAFSPLRIPIRGTSRIRPKRGGCRVDTRLQPQPDPSATACPQPIAPRFRKG